MAVAGTRAFAGMSPHVDAELLPPQHAQLAVNVKIQSGKMEPWKAPLAVGGVTLSGVAPIQTIYRFGQNLDSDTQFWFQFTTDVDVVKGPVKDDTQERTYWTDGVYPKKTDSTIATTGAPYPSNSYRLGIPAPATAPTGSVSGSPAGGATTNTVVYAASYVTAWSEESALSPASGVITYQTGQTVTVTLPSNIDGSYNVTKVRLYRSNSGTARTAFQFVAEVNVGTVNYADTKTAAQLGEVAATTDWAPPPDNMVGLRYVGNEILAGFFANTLCLSEPGVPYAWPEKYRIAFNAPIVGIGAFGQSLFVGTTRGTHLVTGVDPQNMTPEELDPAQSCVSKRSVVEMMGGVVWASPDGLYFVSPGGVRNLTENVFTRDQWQAYKPESIKGYTHDGRYYAVYDTGSEQGTLIFSLVDTPSFVKCDQTWTAAYQDKRRDQLFVVQGNVLKKWDAGSAMTATWRYKDERYPSSLCMSRGKVEAAAYPVTFRLFADGVQQGGDITVANSRAFPLPAVRAEVYSFEVAATSKVISAFIGTAAEELGGTA